MPDPAIDGNDPCAACSCEERVPVAGRSAHETEEEAVAETLTILHDVYADTIENILAIPVLRGRKSESERFPGAVETYTLELARWNKLKALTP
jgi:prolyl-tRNA synthetase